MKALFLAVLLTFSSLASAQTDLGDIFNGGGLGFPWQILNPPTGDYNDLDLDRLKNHFKIHIQLGGGDTKWPLNDFIPEFKKKGCKVVVTNNIGQDVFNIKSQDTYELDFADIDADRIVITDKNEPGRLFLILPIIDDEKKIKVTYKVVNGGKHKTKEAALNLDLDTKKYKAEQFNFFLESVPALVRKCQE